MDWVTPVLNLTGKKNATIILAVLYGAFVLLGIWGWYRRIGKAKVEQKTKAAVLLERDQLLPYGDITPLLDFKWRSVEPLKFRPFKPKFHLSMSLENTTFNELIEMDKNYLNRIILRRKILSDHQDIALQADAVIKPAVDELYIYLTATYLPVRYPTMFRLTSSPSVDVPTHLYNLVTKQPLPLTPPPDPIRALELLGENLDEDFLLLLPSEGGDQYILRGYVVCFPSGFNTKEKFGLRLKDIHGPVPGYKEKLDKSMDRFFERLEAGKIVTRSNWAITTNSDLYTPSGNHLYEGDAAKEEDVDIEKTRLRSERQMLWRLPKSKALVFNFKTYLYPLQDVKDEGLAEALATAINGLKEGSTPATHFYKRGVVWGEAVKNFLRS